MIRSPEARAVRWFALAIALLAISGALLRAMYVLVLGPQATSPGGDWQFYHETPNLIAGGHGFSNWFVARTEGRFLPTASHPPLYPLVLSVVSWFGATTEIAHRLAGLAFGAVTIITLGVLGRRIGGAAAGIVASALAAGHPRFIATDGSLMSETLYGMLIALALLAAYAYQAAPAGGRAALLGAVTGLASLTRSEALLLVPLLVVPVVWIALDRRWRDATIAVMTCALVLAPWAARHWLAFGRPLFTSTNGGTVLVGANCGPSYYGAGIGGWELGCFTPWVTTNEAEQAALWADAGLRYMGSHVERLPLVVAARQLRTWNLWPPTFWDADEGHLPRVDRAGTIAYFMLLPAGVYGLALCRRRGHRIWMFLAPAVMVAIAAAASWGLPRLRYAFEVSLIVPAAIGLEALLRNLAAARNDRSVS